MGEVIFGDEKGVDIICGESRQKKKKKRFMGKVTGEVW